MRDHRFVGFLIAGIAVFLLFIALGIASAIKRDTSVRRAEARSATRLMAAIGHGDGRAACALLTRSAAAGLAAEEREPDCPAAVRRMARSLTPAQRDDLASRSFSTTNVVSSRDGLDYVRPGSNPLGITRLTLVEFEGRRLISRVE